MSSEENKKTHKEFGLSNLSLKNKISVYLIIAIISLGGLITYQGLPKESFPEIQMPQVNITTIYVGNTPKDIENLITKQIEKQVKSVEGLDKIKSVSVQDFSIVIAYFLGDVDVDKALQDVKDAVDKAKKDLPKDLLEEPSIEELNFSKFPVVNINLSGNFSLSEFRIFSENLEEEIETMSEVDEVNIRGLLDKEVHILVDLPAMELNKVNFNDIENAITRENISISGGGLTSGKVKRTIRTIGQFSNLNQIGQIIVKSNNEKAIYLRDIAEIKHGFSETESYSRLNNFSVVSLDVVKKSGENLLNTIDEIKKIIDEAKKTYLPEGIKITLTNDQSVQTRDQLSNLINSIVMGIMLVVLILQFFIGSKNAIFVGLAIPLSMLLSFLILSTMGVTLNLVVLFSLILALGMLVDNGIVTIENINRLYNEGHSAYEAAKIGVGEIAVPIISSTATTLAAFFPLLFWNDLMGKFMYYIPVTLISVLSSSLFVALVINPVLAANFIKAKKKNNEVKTKKSNNRIIIFLLISAVLLYLIGFRLGGSLCLIIISIIYLSKYLLNPISIWFQEIFLIKVEAFYKSFLNYALKKKRPLWFLLSCIALLILSFMFFSAKNVNTLFFPENEPDYINIFVEMPQGTDIEITDSLTKIINHQVDQIIKPYVEAGVVKSVMANVGEGTSDPNEGSQTGKTPNKARITIDFVEFQLRKGISTSKILKQISTQLKTPPSMTVVAEKNANGPPTGKPINIELSGDNFDQLIDLAQNVKNEIEDKNIPGIEALKFDVKLDKPELLIHINRSKATELGVSTAQIGSTIRTALFGKEISKFKEGEDEYPIQLKLKKTFRERLPNLLNQKITFRNVKGKMLQVPISALVNFETKNGIGAVMRTDRKRTITIFSNVLEGYNANLINQELKKIMGNYIFPKNYSYSFTGEQENQEKTTSFLSKALLIAVCLITLILVSQFNSIIKPLIIMITVLFSLIGVLIGIALSNMDFVIIMTGIGIISLAGIVVNNAIVMIDCIDQLKMEEKNKLGIKKTDLLPYKDSIVFIIQGGIKRLKPVLLTAITTVLGLIPLATGFNIDFYGLLTQLKPNIYWGGNNAAFWGPMAWTIIFGLLFSTFLTLIIIPVMYILFERVRNKFVRKSTT